MSEKDDITAKKRERAMSELIESALEHGRRKREQEKEMQNKETEHGEANVQPDAGAGSVGTQGS